MHLPTTRFAPSLTSLKTKVKSTTAHIVTATAIVALALVTTSCGNDEPTPQEKISRDMVFNTTLHEVRLGDGVPLDINVSLRWKIDDYAQFSEQFPSPEQFDSLVLAPRGMELASKVANNYNNVDSVFTTDRKRFINEMKAYMLNHLGESGIEIKEVIVSDVKFPSSFTTAMEQLALQERELERIRKQSEIDLEQSIAAQQQAQEDGKVDMAKAEMNAKVQRINAETEKSIRENRLAQAETQKQVSKLQTQAQAEKQERLAEADLKKQKELKKLEIEHQKEVDQLAIAKQKELDALVFSQDMQMAQLCSENPNYANYMVNKELASKVQIAVLPSTQDASVFSGLLNNGVSQR